MRVADVSETTLANSMTDLMTSLAVVFILLLVAYLNRAFLEQQQWKQKQSVLVKKINVLMTGTKTMKRDFIKEAKGIGIVVTEDPKDPLSVDFDLPQQKLQFDFNSAALKPAGKEFIQDLAPHLATLLDRFYPYLSSVVIEGHTDSDGEDEHNLQLSQERSFTVLRYLLNNCGLNGSIRWRLLDLASANGRGKKGLVLVDGKENKEKSRRVVFRTRFKSIEQRL